MYVLCYYCKALLNKIFRLCQQILFLIVHSLYAPKYFGGYAMDSSVYAADITATYKWIAFYIHVPTVSLLYLAVYI
jgi:hypothetical protein